MRTLIGIPCLDMVGTPFLGSMLNLKVSGEVNFSITQATLIYSARNMIAQQAVEQGYDRIMWLDSDMTFQPDLMERLNEDMDQGLDFVSGLYFRRKDPIEPTVFREVEYKPVDGGDGRVLPVAETYLDYPREELFRVAGVGFGCCMVSVELVDRVAQRFGLPFAPLIGFGEDLSFCKRATELGAELWCDSRIKCGHIRHSVVTEDDWLRR